MFVKMISLFDNVSEHHHYIPISERMFKLF